MASSTRSRCGSGPRRPEPGLALGQGQPRNCSRPYGSAEGRGRLGWVERASWLAGPCPPGASVFLDLSFTKLLILAVIALVVFGPDRLPGLATQAGRMLRELRRMADGA